ncbi:MAG: dihydroorotase [Candidatus Omnitrophota bacterium]
MSSLLIKNGHVIDPANNIDGKLDIFIDRGRIKKVEKDIKEAADETIDASGRIVAPGLIDMHTHLREPGREDEETFLTGSKAAIKGGFTSICAMPNTTPPCDNQGVAGFIISEGKRIGLCNLYPIGTITKNRKGQELSEMGELKKAGVVALSDDGDSVDNSEIMRRALEYASMVELPVIAHCEDRDLSGDRFMNEGDASTLLGLRGIPEIAETTRLSRDVEIARWTNGRIHIAHISAGRSVDIIREAKRLGVNISAEVCPHHFSMIDEEVKGFDANIKVNPPIRSLKDKEALKKGLADGTIDVIATDHAPHTEDEKDTDFLLAPFGMIGLETALSLAVMELIETKVLDWKGLITKMSINPARILGLNKASLAQGKDADIVIIDPKREWTVTKETLESKSKNTPFLGRKLRGMAVATIVGGRLVYEILHS